VSKYVDVLSEAFDGRTIELTDEGLVGYVLACRAALPSRELGGGGPAHESPAAEVAYDRALISLAAANGIAASAEDFCHPRRERHRLEATLADGGIDLAALSYTHPPGPAATSFPSLRP
jgi:hypothetical protein